ncbi:UNKNOWN [Stylonychia lemnae]|uniref:HSA domain-containing protein n=1 Tax=Stylonychia lemnae TaxID=5949 RepID=A0A078AUT6_STYLE|nr:UNKNOWN [Stylonychia lemnae]|eukprot:CDW86160.1 UNKNOWN [Stylonychia lemnae]
MADQNQYQNQQQQQHRPAGINPQGMPMQRQQTMQGQMPMMKQGQPTNMPPQGMPMMSQGQQMQMRQAMPPIQGQQVPGQQLAQGIPGGAPLPTQGSQIPAYPPVMYIPKQQQQSMPLNPQQMAQTRPAGDRPEQLQQYQVSSQEQQRRQQNDLQIRQNMNKFIKEEIPQFHYSQLPQSLDDLYAIKQNSIFKAIFNQHQYGGKRGKKPDEPQVKANHNDFLLAEMTNMAIDFQEEGLYRRVLTLKCAKEAQRYIVQKKEAIKAKIREEQEKILREQQREENEKLEKERQEQQNQQQQAVIDEILIPDNPSLIIKDSLNSLFRMDSVIPNNDNNMNDAFVDPFFDNNQDNEMMMMNDNFGDSNIMFQDNMNLHADIEPSDLGKLDDIALPIEDIVVPLIDMKIDMKLEQLEVVQQDGKEAKKVSDFQVKMGDVITDISEEVALPDKDALDGIDLFYQISDLSLDNEQDLENEFNKSLSAQQHIHELANQVINNKLQKYKDILINDANVRKDKKKRKQQLKELFQSNQKQADLGPLIDPSNIEGFFNTDQNFGLASTLNQNRNLQGQFQIQQDAPIPLLVPVELDQSYKKKEVQVLQQDDIFYQGFDEETDLGDQMTYENLEKEEEKRKKREKQEKQKPIARPDSENPYSDDDQDFFETVPEPQGCQYYEFFIKITNEKNRRALLSQFNQNKQRLYESDNFLFPDKNYKMAQKNLMLKQNLNPQVQLDQEVIKQFYKTFPSKKPPNNLEQAFIFWYASILGDEWRIVSDVLNYHPFTKGFLRESDEVMRIFYLINEQLTLFYHPKIAIDPWRVTGLPLLINQRPPSLLNSVHQSCLIHQNNLKAFQESIVKSKFKFRITLGLNQNKNLVIISTKVIQEHSAVSQNDQEEFKQEKTSILTKRPPSPYANLDQDQSDQIQQTKKESSEGQIPTEALDEVIKQQLNYQQQMNERFQQRLSLQVNETNRQIQEGASGAQISFYQYYDKLYQPPMKRRKIQDVSQLNQQKQQKYQRTSRNFIDISKISPNDRNTPLMNALSLKASDGQEYYQKSIFQKNTTIYWISYLLKKLYQQEKEHVMKSRNSEPPIIEQVDLNTKYILSKRVMKQSEECAKIQRAYQKGMVLLTQEEKDSSERIKNINESLSNYQVETTVAGIDMVGDIWGGNTIFHYDQKTAINQLITETDSAERHPEYIKQTWEKKWEMMDCYWFQQHKHLSPNEKKKDPSSKYLEQFYNANQQPSGMSSDAYAQYLQQQRMNRMPPTAGAPGGKPEDTQAAMQHRPGQGPPNPQMNMMIPIDQQGGGGAAGGTGGQPNPNQQPNINLMRSQQQIHQQQQLQRQASDLLRQQQIPQGQYPPGYQPQSIPPGQPQMQMMPRQPPGGQQIPQQMPVNQNQPPSYR